LYVLLLFIANRPFEGVGSLTLANMCPVERKSTFRCRVFPHTFRLSVILASNVQNGVENAELNNADGALLQYLGSITDAFSRQTPNHNIDSHPTKYG
jgi:hypothetical protein